MATICDDTTVQPVLPQFILGNHHILKVHEMQAKADLVPNNVFVVRAKSSWVKQRIDVHDSTTIARMFAGEEHQQSRVIVMGRLSGTLPSLGVANSTQCQGVPVLCAYQHDLATAAVGCVRFPTVQGSRQEGVSTKPAAKT